MNPALWAGFTPFRLFFLSPPDPLALGSGGGPWFALHESRPMGRLHVVPFVLPLPSKSADFEGVRETDAARGFAALAYGLLVLFSPVFRPSSLVPRGVGVAQGCARRRVSEANRPKGGS